MDSQPLTASDAGDWTYRGEGAANIVLGYRGSAPSFVAKVLRVRKVPKDGSSDGAALTEQEMLLWADVEGMPAASSREEAGRAFVVGVMRELLGHDHVDAGAKIPVSKDFLASVGDHIAKQRPSWRVDAATIDASCDHALLLPDHAVFPPSTPDGSPCITVEIKPKWGLIPSSDYISTKNGIKKRATRFRMHQLLKLKNGEILKPSEYDPLDLFSNRRDRINKAIRALFATPQNNLRVFLDGSIVFGALGGALDRCVADGKNMASEDSTKAPIQARNGFSLSTVEELISEAILKSGALDSLSNAQKLDRLDVEGAIHAYYNILARPCLVCERSNDAALSERCTFLHNLTLDESMRIVREYLIAATAKDCSLMISFRPLSGLNNAAECNTIFLESTNQVYEFKVSFIDLDLKPLDKMVYYYELDQKIVDFYATMTAQNDYCSAGEIAGEVCGNTT